MRFQAAVVENDADLAVAVVQVVAVYRAAEFGRSDGAGDLGGGNERALDDVPHGHHAFQAFQVVVGELDFAAYGGGGDFAAAEGLQDVVVARCFAVAGVGGDGVVDAAPVQRGFEHEVLQVERLLAGGGQDDVAALLAQVEVAARGLGVA